MKTGTFCVESNRTSLSTCKKEQVAFSDDLFKMVSGILQNEGFCIGIFIKLV